MKLTKKELALIGNWLRDGDYGSSSLYLCSLCLGGTPQRIDYPLDPSDFRRCYNFLSLFPLDIRYDLIKKAANYSVKWKSIYDNWGILCELYEKESNQEYAPELYRKMMELGL